MARSSRPQDRRLPTLSRQERRLPVTAVVLVALCVVAVTTPLPVSATDQDDAETLVASIGIVGAPSDAELDLLWDDVESDAVKLLALDIVRDSGGEGAIVATATKSFNKRPDLAPEIMASAVTSFPNKAVEVATAAAADGTVSDGNTVTLVTETIDTLVDQTAEGTVHTITPGAVAIQVSFTRSAVKASIDAAIQGLAKRTHSEAIPEATGGVIEFESDGVSVNIDIPDLANTGGGAVDVRVFDCRYVSESVSQTGNCIGITPHTFAQAVTLKYTARAGANRCYKATDETSNDWRALYTSECSVKDGVATYLSHEFSVFDSVFVSSATSHTHASATGYRGSQCPNGCSANGRCGIDSECTCNTRWTGADCSQRMCREAVSWDRREGTAKPLTTEECSGRGTCDRKTGLCRCSAGFEGEACKRRACPRGLPYGRPNEITPDDQGDAEPYITRVSVTAPNADRLRRAKARAKADTAAAAARAQTASEAAATRAASTQNRPVSENAVFSGSSEAQSARNKIEELKRRRRTAASSTNPAVAAANAAATQMLGNIDADSDSGRATSSIPSARASPTVDSHGQKAAPDVNAEGGASPIDVAKARYVGPSGASVPGTVQPPPVGSPTSAQSVPYTTPKVDEARLETNNTRAIKRAVMPERPRPPETTAMRRARAEAEERRKLSLMVCSGHGTCEFMNELTPGWAETNWESEKLLACRCDGGWYGADCSLRHCPRGDDPNTVPESFTGEVRTITLNTADDPGSVAMTGEANWIVRDTFGLTYTSRPFDVTSATEAINALLDTENVWVATLTLTVSNVGNVHTNEFEITLATPSTLDMIWIDGDDNQDFPGSYPRRAAISGGLDNIQYAVTAERDELYEWEYCGNRGLCDTSQGKCVCFEGYGGVACETKTVFA